ncbi:MAG: hypothetical protein ABWY54_04530 [Glaciihabitans sp.]
MTSLPTELLVLIGGFVVMTALIAITMAKTVRYHGWGKQTWAPPAVPWFIASMTVGVLTLGYLALWALS